MKIKMPAQFLALTLAVFALSARGFWQEPPPSPPVPERILVLRLSDEGRYMVDQVQADFLIERLQSAEEEGFTRVILKIDTFGGVVYSAREITEQLIRMTIPTTAYVETKAISAGAFIAWACDEIVMQSHTTIGDAQMIMQTPEGIEEAPEKMVTVFRSDWQKLSEAKGRSFALAQGFFDQAVEVLQVGEPDDFEFILRDDYERLPVDERPPELEIISKAGQLLTLHAEKAEELELVEVFPDFESYLQARSYPTPEVNEMTLNQQILRFLGANSWIFFLLTLIGLNGIYMEIKAPGFGIPGFTAIVCFTLVLGSRYLLGTASMLELLVFVLGIALCVVEIFVLPGLGVVGLAGILCMFGALVLASFPDFGGMPSYDFQFDWLTSLSLNLIAVFFVSIFTLVFLLPRLFTLPGARRGVLKNEMRAEDGYVLDTGSQYLDLKGQSGVAVGDLRPVGKIRLADGRLLDVTAGSDFIPDETRVRIAAIEGNRILVQAESIE